MSPELSTRLRRSLIAHEQYRKYPYVDSVGKVTIGIGFNLTDRGMTDDWILTEFERDIQYFYDQFSNFEWFNDLNEDRQIVLIDMAYNLGWLTFLTFTALIDALTRKDYEKAAYEMLNSKWARQVKSRAADLAQGMLTGIYHV